MLEIIHFIPMLLLILACLFGMHKSLKANFAVFFLSLVGIAFGTLFHASHAVTMFDPCIVSITVAIYCAFNILKLIAVKKQEQ